MKALILVVGFLAVCVHVHAAEIPYNFTTLDIHVDPGMVISPVDINSKDAILERTWRSVGNEAINGALIAQSNNRRFKKFRDIELFDCRFTDPMSLNDAGQATGFCDGGAFLRQPDGKITILAGPTGALQNTTTGLHISSNGRVGGQFCALAPGVGGCLWRGFTWHPLEGYRVIDFIDNFGLGTHTDTAVIASTSLGKILVEYITETDAGNEALAHGFAVLDNGVWSFPFPLSFEWRGGPYLTISDFTDDGQAIIVFTGNDGTRPKISLFDDDRFYDVAGWPVDWLLVELGGMANETTSFVGTYAIPHGVPPGITYEYHGFLAQSKGLK